MSRKPEKLHSHRKARFYLYSRFPRLNVAVRSSLSIRLYDRFICNKMHVSIGVYGIIEIFSDHLRLVSQILNLIHTKINKRELGYEYKLTFFHCGFNAHLSKYRTDIPLVFRNQTSLNIDTIHDGNYVSVNKFALP